MSVIIRIAAYSSIAVCALVFWAYVVRPDWATALTLFPAWTWLAFVIFVLPCIKKYHGQIGLACWLVFLVFHVEEPASFLHGFLPITTTPSLRVATVNCTGSFNAITDALAEDPDIILVQESPAPSLWDDFLKAYPDHRVLAGIDTSILAKGRVHFEHQGPFYTIAAIHTRSTILRVGSLRLATSDPRIDLWNPACWRSQKAMRQKQLAQISEVQSHLPDSLPIILGGDFNVPQHDKVFMILENRLNDSFAGAGRGVCNTIIADLPLLRIDQIWTSPALKSVNAYTKQSIHTDHRIYVADFLLPPR